MPGIVADFQTDLHSGAATATYPIELPPGPGGFTPNLTLTYNSGSVSEMKNKRDVGSWVGTGWSLGLSRVFYNEEDDEYSLELNGTSSELVLDSGSNWSTNPERFLSITKDTVGSYTRWVILGRDGTEYTFGGTIETVQYRDTGSGTVDYRFDLQKMVDTNGNQITASYTPDVWNGTVRSAYLTTLTYGLNTVTFDSSFDSTDPTDGNLRDDNPKGTTNFPAPPVVENKKLDSIKVKVNGSLVRQYDFQYINDTTSDAVYSTDYDGIYYAGQHRLKSVSQLGAVGPSILSTTTFTYTSRQIYFNDPDLPTSYREIYVADTGNDRIQVFAVNGSFVREFSASGGPIGLAADATPYVYYLTADAGAYSKITRVTSTGGSPSSTTYCNNQNCSPQGLDVDSSRIYVAEYASNSTGEYRRYLISGFPTTEGTRSTMRLRDVAKGPTYMYLVNDTKIEVRDVDGSPLYATYDAETDIATGAVLRAMAFDGNYAYVTDIGNDVVHKCDVTSGFDCTLSFGGSGSPGGALANPHGVAVGDGLVYVSDTGNTRIQVFKTNGTFVRKWGSGGSGPGEFTNPNELDLGPSGGTWGNPGNPAILDWEYVTKADNGFGGSVSYVYNEQPSSPVDNAWTRQAVVSRTVDPDPGTETDGVPITTTYSYASAPEYVVEDFDYINAEFRGFREVRETQADDSYADHFFYTEGTFNVTHPVDGAIVRDGDKLKGREYETVEYDSVDTELRRRFTDSNFAWVDQPAGIYEIRLENAGSVVGSTKVWTRYEYDSYGNVIKQKSEGDTANTGDESTTFRGFTPRTSCTPTPCNSWIVNRPDFERTYVGLVASDDRGANLRSEVRFYYDGQAYQTAPTDGDLTKVESYKDATTFLTTTHAYDSYGNRTSTTDPNGNTTSFTFDTTHRAYVTQVTFPTVPGGTFTEQYAWDYLMGVPTSYTDINSKVTNWEYDTFGRLCETWRPGHGGTPNINGICGDGTGDPTEKYSYQNWGTAGTQRVKIESKVDASPVTYLWREEYFDGLGRVVQTRSLDESSKHLVSGTSTFDGRGLLAGAYVPWRVVDTTAVGYLTPPGGTLSSSYTYDELGRTLTATGPDDAVTTHAWAVASGPRMVWQETVTDPLGHQKRYTTDTEGNLATVEEFDAALALYQTATYTYDTIGTLTQVVIDPVDAALPNPTTTMSYDWLGRKASMTDPDMGTWSYDYDSNGNLQTQTDARGVKIRFVYDALDREIERRECTIADCSTYNVLATYGYDDTTGGNVGKGRRTSMTDDSSGSSTFTYDSRGRLTQEVKTIQSTPYTTSYTYDPSDRVETTTLPNSEVVTQTYNNRSQPSTLSSSTEGTLVSSSVYNQIGLPTQRNLGNGTRTDREYWGIEHLGTPTNDQYGRLYRINTFRTSDSLQHQDLQFAWDDVGNLTSREDIVATEAATFRYDFLDRLAQAPEGPDDLVSYWSFDDTTISGTTATDLVDTNDGTITGAVSITGKHAGALDFDGVDDYVRVSDDPSLEASAYTLSLWLQWDDLGTDNLQVITEKFSTQHAFWTGWDPGVNALTFFPAGHPATTTSAANVLHAGWNHIVGVYTGTEVYLYVDGVEVASRTGVTGDSLATDWDFTIGSRAGTSNFFDGLIDDVRYFARALTPTEVAAIYNGSPQAFSYDALGNITSNSDLRSYSYASSSPHAVTQTGPSDLVSYWTMDADTVSGTDLEDIQGANDGTLTSGPTSQAGKFGNAFSFDGVDDHVVVPDDPSLEASAYTMSLWLQWDDIGTSNTQVVTEKYIEQHAFWTGWDAGVNGLSFMPAGHPATTTSASSALHAGWNHVVGVYTGSEVYLYVDGVEVASRTGVTGGSLSSTYALTIGRRTGGTLPFDGAIDDVRYYGRALTPEEVAELYSDPPGSYRYDANGNMIGRNGETLTFDAQNRFASWTDGTDTATFVYDADGNRVAKTESSVTRRYVNGWYEIDVTASVATVHYALGGSLVAVKEGSTLGYLHSDHLGSSSVSTDTAGAEVGDQTYLPYGDEQSSSGTLGTERRFTGQRFDGGSGLYFYNARYYDAQIGRFISADTIIPNPTNPQDFNRYTYVRNNPLRYTDPTGRNHMGYGDLSNAGNYYRAQTTRGDEFGFCGCWTNADLRAIGGTDVQLTPRNRGRSRTQRFVDSAANAFNTGMEATGDAALIKADSTLAGAESGSAGLSDALDRAADIAEQGNINMLVEGLDILTVSVEIGVATTYITKDPWKGTAAALIAFIAIAAGPDEVVPVLRTMSRGAQSYSDHIGEFRESYSGPSNYQYETADMF